MTQKYYIGLDLGSSSLKIVATDKQLRVIYTKQYAYSYKTLDSVSREIEPTVWRQLMFGGLRELFTQLPDIDCGGIGLTGQMHTTVFLNAQGQSIRPAIMWNDNRTKALIPQLRQQLAKNPATSINAQSVSPGSPLANLVWLHQFEPLHWQQLAHVLMPVDYLVYCLTEQYVTDYCEASTTSYYDWQTNQWSLPIQQQFHLQSDWFPRILPASTLAGALTASVQQTLHIQKPIPVTVGTGDNAATTFINRGFSEQQPLISLGTSGVVIIPNTTATLKPIGKNVVVQITPQNRHIITQGTIQAGAQLNSWWVENILGTHNFTVEQNQIAPTRLGQNPVLFFPHVNGEKTLFANPNLQGSLVGLTLEVTRADLYQAILEGVAFGIKMLYEKMKNPVAPSYFTAVGGGTHSALWLTIIANVLNLPLRRLQPARQTVQGAAALALLATGGQWEQIPFKQQLIQPTPQLAVRYQQQYHRYQRLTTTMINYFSTKEAKT